MVFIFLNQIEVWNKIDLLKHPVDYDQIETQDYPIIPISALHNTNVKKLLTVMEQKSNEILNKKTFTLKYNIDLHFQRLKWLYENGNISAIQNERHIFTVRKGDATIIEYEVTLDEVTYNRYIATHEPE